MLTSKGKRQALQIIPFVFIAMIFATLYSFLEKGILGDHLIYPSTGNPYFFNPFSSALFGLIFGILIGVVEIFILNKKFRRSSFSAKIIYKTFIYMGFVVLSTLLVSIIGHAYELKAPIWNKEVLNYGLVFFSSFAFWTVEIYMGLGICFSLFYLEVSDNIGQQVLLNTLTGKYHQPIEEERIFLFLDMKNSTTIAEKLGHIRYFEMLREYYSDLTDPIIEFGGEVYQYVGDEIVISWKLKKGLKNNNCVNCFFAMKRSLSGQSERFKEKYGIIPTFKAGVHYGKVTTGEIGVVKKEIAFTGDVLNTTARIQSMCNAYEVDLLVSERLINALSHKSQFDIKSLGEKALRGRNEKVNLYAIERVL